jgi:hypothetical protein
MGRQGLRAWGGKRVSMRDAYALLMSAVNSEISKTRTVLEFMGHTPSLEQAISATGSRATKPLIPKMQTRLAVCDLEQLQIICDAALAADNHLKREGWRDVTKVIELFAFKVLKRKK